MDGQLWFNDDRTDFFVIPPDTEVPRGSRWLRTFDRTSRSFDPDALEPYRVDAEVAHRHVGAWIEGGYQTARAAFARGYGEESPLPESLEGALGVDPGALGSDPEALQKALENVGDGVKRWLQHEAPPEVAQAVQGVVGTLSQLFQQLSEPPPEPEPGPSDEKGSATE